MKLGSDFTGVLTKNEKPRQNILQTVELARRAFPKATRKSFLGNVTAASSLKDIMKGVAYDASQ